MNKFMTAMKNDSNYGYTENGAVKHLTTGSKVYDLFALGGAYRSRSDIDILTLFSDAYNENEELAMKCLFYLRDAREGQGERRFFRVCMRWLANGTRIEAARRNLKYVAEYGRWDDLYTFEGTVLEKEMFAFLKEQLTLDVQCKTPSLLAKWLKSENTSSAESCRLGRKTREAFGMTAKQYRKTLSILRERINVLERLMSAGKWDEIEFDKIPSKAGFIYRNAFARHDIERMKSEKEVQSYADFAKDTTTTVNAKVLYPYECVNEGLKVWRKPADNTERLMVNKYWDNLADYINNATFDGIAVVDTSGSMMGSRADAPINVALSLGMYCATKAKGPYANHFFSFNDRPEFLEIHGFDFVDKLRNIVEDADWGGSTNVEAVFDKILQIARENHLSQSDIPSSVIVISDMEFNACVSSNSYRGSWYGGGSLNKDTLFESMAKKWATYGYKLPRLYFWNVEARSNNIAMKDDGNVTYISGCSPVIYEQIMSGKTSFDLMLDKLLSDRYAAIH